MKKELAEGQFFESRIDKYLLNNQHRLTFIMRPEADYAARQNQEEQDRLQVRVSQLTEADKKEILEEGKLLAANQDKVEDLSCLPTLQMGDISPKMKRTVLDHTGVANTPVQWRTTATNGITYFRAISSLPALSDDLKLYLPLFCDVSGFDVLCVYICVLTIIHSLCCHLAPIPKVWLILMMRFDCIPVVYVHPLLYPPAILVSLLLSLKYQHTKKRY